MNEFVHNMNLYSKQVPPYPLQNQLTTQIRKSALEKGYTEWTHIWSGQSTRLADTVDAAQLTKILLMMQSKLSIISDKAFEAGYLFLLPCAKVRFEGLVEYFHYCKFLL